MGECLFCGIVTRKVPGKIVYEDADVLAFEDINPQAPVHVLIIPKEHIPTILDFKERHAQVLLKMVWTASKLATERGIADAGFRLVLNCNREAGQSVFHVHLHVLGGRPMAWPPG